MAKGHSVGKSQVQSNAGSATAHILHVPLFHSGPKQNETGEQEQGRLSERYPRGRGPGWTAICAPSASREGMVVTPAVSLSSRLTTLPRSLSRASATLCCRRQLWVAPSPGKGSPVGFPQFPKGEATHATFQGNEHPGKCPSWFQNFLDALASPRETSWTTEHCICLL